MDYGFCSSELPLFPETCFTQMPDEQGSVALRRRSVWPHPNRPASKQASKQELAREFRWGEGSKLDISVQVLCQSQMILS